MLDVITHEYNKSVAYLNKGNYKKALAILKKCLSQVEFKEAYLNIGNCYRMLGQDTKMIESYKKACSPKITFLDGHTVEEYPAGLNNLGLAYYMCGYDDLAIECYERAMAVEPKFWDAWWNCSTAVLRKASSGQLDLFPRGWMMYDARFLKTPPIKMKNTKASLVYWDKVSSGTAIIVLAEQGIGDAIMWGRYLPLLAEKFSEVYVQCDAGLESVFSDYKCVRDASECPAELAIPMCTLSRCFDTIPSGDWLRDKFSAFDFGPSERLNVGIVHCGSATHANDHNRSVPIHRFHFLSKYVNLYSLVPGFNTTKHVTGLDIRSWEDTAKYINGLDLVISVDTSVAHMAGSLGAKTWLLQPLKETDFRWGNNISSSVWYDSIQIFNNPNSWEHVFSQVEDAIQSELYL
jgi:hypothetical protein